MIEIKNKVECCGCGACASVCPKHCIKMQADNEGFKYPQVDITKCVDCRLCEKVCPLLHKPEPQEPLAVYGAKNVDDSIRLHSSSGGLFTAFAREILAQHGIVYGAEMTSELQVQHCAVSEEAELTKLRGSKYVQSEMGECYKQARFLLQQGRKVLFSGTPCQIAGLKGFLNKEYPNLYTVDVVCHGVPSAKVYAKHLQEIGESVGEPVVKVRFRDKQQGWKHGQTLFYTENHCCGDSKRKETYMRLFLNNVTIRPSCSDCAFNNKRSRADITIADYWGIDKQHPEFDDDKGVTLVIVNTEKGQELMQAVSKEIICLETSFAAGAEYNVAVSKSLGLHPQRAYFFENMDKKSLRALAEEIL